jgi:hypothetical protein
VTNDAPGSRPVDILECCGIAVVEISFAGYDHAFHSFDILGSMPALNVMSLRPCRPSNSAVPIAAKKTGTD